MGEVIEMRSARPRGPGPPRAPGPRLDPSARALTGEFARRRSCTRVDGRCQLSGVLVLIRATASVLTVLVSTVVLTAVGAGPASAGGHPPTSLGPGEAGVSDIGGKAVIRYSKYGPVYIAGKQNTHLRIDQVKHGLRFRDTGTGGIKGSLPDRCSRQK